MKRAKEDFFGVKLKDMLKSNTRKFWSTIGPQKATGTPKGLINDEGNPMSDSECANSLNVFFGEVFTSEIFPLPTCDPDVNIPFLDKVSLTSLGIRKLIDNLPHYSSPGNDNITAKLLKLTAPYSSSLLSLLYQQSIDLGVIPKDWKHAKVLPIFKSGDKNSPNNYRPISLTSIPCKLLEHILYSNIMSHLSDNDLLFCNQHGFRKHKSCETQLFELVNGVHEAIHSRVQTDAVFIDFSKAFDRVPHQRLLKKLGSLNLYPMYTNWILNFLSHRTQSVTINKETSNTINVISGVPQGSVLGPLLFLVYINDLPTNITSKIRLFADDCVIYRQIRNSDDASQLQRDLDSITAWCTDWQMCVNVSKSKVMTFSTKKSNITFDYTLANRNLERVTKYKYLGVILTEKLDWKEHIDFIVGRANQSLGFLKRHLYLAPPEVRILAYTSFVRSKVEYASVIWNPWQINLTQKLESVQNKAARFIYKDYSHSSSVTALKSRAGLQSLSSRRKQARLLFLHKIYYFNQELKKLLLLPPHHISPRIDHPFKIRLSPSRTKQFSESPLQLAIKDWNSLPESVAGLADVALFRDACETLFSD